MVLTEATLFSGRAFLWQELNYDLSEGNSFCWGTRTSALNGDQEVQSASTELRSSQTGFIVMSTLLNLEEFLSLSLSFLTSSFLKSSGQ